MRSHIYRCPFGATTLRADNEKSLQSKISDHNIMAHGRMAIITCTPRPVHPEPWDKNSATSLLRHATVGFSLSGRAI